MMVVVANSVPNFRAVENSFGPTFAEGPILKFVGTPPDGLATGGSGFIGSLNGLNQAVFAYGGAMLFVAFLAEMRHPWDFWKCLLCSSTFIYVVYIFFGIFVYSYQGQYAYNPASQSLSPYKWQTVCNIMNIITSLIAGALFGNIGIKVANVEILSAMFHLPSLTSNSGKWLWAIMGPLYWVIAFVICAAIPAFSYISGIIGAVCVLSFTYTFPAILAVGFQIQKDAMLPEERFDSTLGTCSRVDQGVRRWIRGYKLNWLLNTCNIMYFLGALATSALGCYSSILGLISVFSGASVATSFGCTSPV